MVIELTIVLQKLWINRVVKKLTGFIVYPKDFLNGTDIGSQSQVILCGCGHDLPGRKFHSVS